MSHISHFLCLAINYSNQSRAAVTNFYHTVLKREFFCHTEFYVKSILMNLCRTLKSVIYVFLGAQIHNISNSQLL